MEGEESGDGALERVGVLRGGFYYVWKPFQCFLDMERKWRRVIAKMNIPKQDNEEKDKVGVYKEKSVAKYDSRGMRNGKEQNWYATRVTNERCRRAEGPRRAKKMKEQLKQLPNIPDTQPGIAGARYKNTLSVVNATFPYAYPLYTSASGFFPFRSHVLSQPKNGTKTTYQQQYYSCASGN